VRKGAAPSRGSIEGAPGSQIVADDEQDFTLSEVHVPQKNNNKYIENIQNIILQEKLLTNKK
jgi:hypothetical protein